MIDLDKTIIGLIIEKAECLNVHQGFYAKLHNVTARTTRNTPARRWEYSISIDVPSAGLHCLKEFVWDGCIDEGVDRKAPEIFEDLFTKVIESINKVSEPNPAYDPENVSIVIVGDRVEGFSDGQELKSVETSPLQGLPSYHFVNGELVNSETGIKKSEEVDFNKVKIL